MRKDSPKAILFLLWKLVRLITFHVFPQFCFYIIIKLPICFKIIHINFIVTHIHHTFYPIT